MRLWQGAAQKAEEEEEGGLVDVDGPGAGWPRGVVVRVRGRTVDESDVRCE
jgi:hypothetical protein